MNESAEWGGVNLNKSIFHSTLFAGTASDDRRHVSEARVAHRASSTPGASEVRFVKETINASTWRAMGTRIGQEVISGADL